MSFRYRLLAVLVITIVLAVTLVEWTVSAATRRAFERVDDQRSSALVAQFRREFAARGAQVARRVKGIAGAASTLQMAIDLNRPDPDYSRYVNEAQSLATAQGLDFLELLAADGTIISSAQWPARFGYKEEWIKGHADWKSQKAFLKREELPDDEIALALTAVDAVDAGDQKLYVVGGERIDKHFLASLVLPAGMRVLLYRNTASLHPDEAPLEPLIERMRRTRREVTQTIAWSSDPSSTEIFHAIPLLGREDQYLGALLVGSSRRELAELLAFLRRLGFLVGGAGILLGAAISWWASARITRPVRELAEGARKVTAGDWTAHVEISTEDEIGALARAFNQMTGQLIEQRERLVQSERVAAWRELARRLAHELKNPLFPLQITVENMQRARALSPEQFDEVFRESAETLLAELSNLKQIIGRFSDFAKMPPPHLEPVEVNGLVGGTIKLFEAQLSAPDRPPIELTLDLAADVPLIQADPEQLSRALQNLVLNAIDAMPGGGKLSVRTSRHDGGVRLEVSDTGEGLKTEECARLFTPYYTTKRHGTGLGLAIVQSVVSDHHGRIAVQSEPGKGATFVIDLAGAAAPPASRAAASAPGREERLS